MNKNQIKIKAYICYDLIFNIIFTISMIAMSSSFDWTNKSKLLVHLTIFFMALTCTFNIINSWFTGKHFDKRWKHEIINNPHAVRYFSMKSLFIKNPLHSRLERAGIYAFNVVQKNKSKNNRFSRLFFYGFDFRGNARLVDKIFSFAYAYSFLFACISGLIGFSMKVYNYFW